jgi:hypothetical protein
MLPVLVLLLFLLLSSAAASSPVIVPEGPEHHVTMVLKFPEKYSEIALTEMKKEVQQILAPAGVRVQWETLEDASHKVFESLLIIAELRGRCRRDRVAPEPAMGAALGITHVASGEIISACRIDCDAVRVLLESSMASMSFVQFETAMGRALGRIAAHEMYHIMGATRSHSEEGIAQRRFTTADLVRPEMFLDPWAAGLIRARMQQRAGLLLPQSPVPVEDQLSAKQRQKSGGAQKTSEGEFIGAGILARNEDVEEPEQGSGEGPQEYGQ